MSSSSLYVFVVFGVSFEWLSLDELRRQLTHGGRQACVQRPISVFSFDKFRDDGITAVPSCDNCGFVGPNDGFFFFSRFPGNWRNDVVSKTKFGFSFAECRGIRPSPNHTIQIENVHKLTVSLFSHSTIHFRTKCYLQLNACFAGINSTYSI